MSDEKVFTDGLIFKLPRDGNTYDFVKGSLSIKVDEFKEFLDKHVSNGWVNVDLLTAKGSGKPYASLNEWKPKTDSAPAAEPDDMPF